MHIQNNRRGLTDTPAVNRPMLFTASVIGKSVPPKKRPRGTVLRRMECVPSRKTQLKPPSIIDEATIIDGRSFTTGDSFSTVACRPRVVAKCSSPVFRFDPKYLVNI